MDIEMTVWREQGVFTEELGDLLTSYLEELGVEYVFGVPGGAIEPLVNALARSERRGGPRCITTRHETGAAFMAEGYHSASGKLAVCFATTGPGTTNLVTGVASAYANNVPMLVITAQSPLDTFGRGAFQESSCTGINALSIFESITRYNTLISHRDQFETKLAAAIITAFQQPCGPVHMSIPLDVMRTRSPKGKKFTQLKHHVRKPIWVDEHGLSEFHALLMSSTKPVFVIGNEASECASTILQIAAWLDIPLVATPHGNGLISPYHPLYRGVIGFAGHSSALASLRDPEVDLVVAIGSSLGEWASNGWDEGSLLNARLVHIDSSENHFSGSPMARLHVRGNLSLIFERVRQQLNDAGFGNPANENRIADELKLKQRHFTLDDPAGFVSDQEPILPQRLMAALPEIFPAGTHYLADTGNSFAWGIHYLHPNRGNPVDSSKVRGGLFRTCFEFASMGWAIGSAVGTALGLPKTPIVCITGDGSYLMSGQEITVALERNLPVIYIILNDSAYGMVRHGQLLSGAEQTGFALPRVDFAAMARAMGIDGHVIKTVTDLYALDIKTLCEAGRPTLLDVRIDPDAQPPLGVRINTLKGK